MVRCCVQQFSAVVWCGVLCSFGSGFLSGRLLPLRFSRQTIICDSRPLVYGAPSNAAETVFALPHALTHPRSPRQVARRWMDGGVAGCGGWRRRLNEAVAEKKRLSTGVKQRPRIGGGRCSEVARHRRPRAVVLKMPLEKSRALATTPRAWREAAASCQLSRHYYDDSATIWFLRFPVMLWLFN